MCPLSEAVFIPSDDGHFVATELARGPWDPDAQNGGAPAALLARAFERVQPEAGLALARVTYDFIAPVPLGELEVSAELVRGGRRVQLLKGSIRAADGTEVVRASALRVARAELAGAGRHSMVPPGPGRGRPNDFRSECVMFSTDAMEIRFVDGSYHEPGPATAWFRFECPLLVGEETSPLQRLAAAADFGNGISATMSWEDHVFINPDLTLYVERVPRGEWICLQSETRVSVGGAAISQSMLYDELGRVGAAVQAVIVGRR